MIHLHLFQIGLGKICNMLFVNKIELKPHMKITLYMLIIQTVQPHEIFFRKEVCQMWLIISNDLPILTKKKLG